MMYMNAKDTVAGALAEVYVTIDNVRYNCMHLYNFTADDSMNNVEINRLGTTAKGHKSTSVSGSWSATGYYGMPIFHKIAQQFRKTGVMPYFTIQVTNDDPTSGVGRQTKIFRDCLIDKVTVAKFDASSDALTEDISGTYDDYETAEEFTLLDGVI